MTNIFMSSLSSGSVNNNGFKAKTGSGSQRKITRGRYGLENDTPGVGIPGENDQPEDLIQAEAAVSQADSALADRVETEVTMAEAEVAVEAFRHTIASNLRNSYALENLAEQLEDTVQGDGEGITPEVASIVTTAIEPTVGEEPIGLESFSGNSRVATESMIDSIKEKASSYMATAGASIKTVIAATSQMVRTMIDNFRDTKKVLEEMKAKMGALEEHAGKAIEDEGTLKHLNKQLGKTITGKSGDGTVVVLGILNKSVGSLVNSANQMYETLSNMVNTFEGGADERTIGREAKRFFDQARKFISAMPNANVHKLNAPESFDLASLASPEVAKSKIASAESEEATNNFTFKIISADVFEKIESAIGNAGEALSTLAASTQKKAQLGEALIKAGSAKQGKEEEEGAVQQRRAAANVLVAANMICRDAAAICAKTAQAGEKAALMLVRASFRASGIAAKASADSAETNAQPN